MNNSEIIISINALSKTYKLYQRHRDRLKELIHPFRKKYHQPYHALKNINIEVRRGDILGIIGQNGSGKSTLLKILNSVVSPTSGTFYCNGNISAILELSGGFNTELTGVENIYFLGGLRGIRKDEMKQRLKTILDFADIGEYAYQPVKNYSSGMHVRLAFSIAINIDPDILIIDEALAVGDLRFQNKCFRKLQEFVNQGKTMVICTHNLLAVKTYCTRAIWLHKGEIAGQGAPDFVADSYNSFMSSGDKFMQIKKKSEKQPRKIVLSEYTEQVKPKEIEWQTVAGCDSYGTGGAQVESVALYNMDTLTKSHILFGGENLRLYIKATVDKKLHSPGLAVVMNGKFGVPVFRLVNYAYAQPIAVETGKLHHFAIDFQLPKLGNDTYSFSVGILDATSKEREELEWIHDAIVIDLSNPDNKYKKSTLMVLEDATFRTVSEEELRQFAMSNEQ